MQEGSAAILVIGNELLSGKVEDTNTPFLIRELRELGVSLREIHTLPDEAETIARAAREVIPRYDHVFTTGGVGPTHDDITLGAIARALDVPLVRNRELEEAIHAFYGEGVNEQILTMADLPEGAVLLHDSRLVVPVVAVGNVYIFPGEPTFLRRKFTAIRERFRVRPFRLIRLFTRLDEGEIAATLQGTEGRFGVQVGSYPRFDAEADYRVMVTVEGKDAEAVRQAAAAIWGGIPEADRVRRDGDLLPPDG